MSRVIDETHDPSLRSWVDSANQPGAGFPIQNLPFGVFRHSDAAPRLGVAIGDQVLDLRRAAGGRLLGELPAELAAAVGADDLGPLLALDRAAWSLLRQRLSRLLRVGSVGNLPTDRPVVPMAGAEMQLPVAIGDYTDFYASVFHATNVGKLFRPDNPLLPNYKHVPIGYHGRASSIVASGSAVRRPSGQRKPPDVEAPSFGPSRGLDYELEVGFLVGPGNRLGEPIPIAEAEEHIFGLCLVNDWSARDVQSWEYQPLGPFLSKSFATSVSPWIVTLEALAPFRCPAYSRPEGDPEPLPYLRSPGNAETGGVDLALEVWLSSESMRGQGQEPQLLSRSSLRDMYWTLSQMLTHHASNGCNLRPGDLLASGTVSGPEPTARACLLELAARGTEPVQLASGEQRAFLSDGDEVILRGHCEREGYVTIGFGECRGVVLPALETNAPGRNS